MAKTNILRMGWLANEDQGLAKEDIKTNTGTSTDHSIFTFFNDISSLAEGTYKWTVASGQNNNCFKMNKSLTIFHMLLVLFFIFFYSCEGAKHKKNTPKEFLNHVMIAKEDYTKDSVDIIIQLKGLLLMQEDFFHNKSYFDSTQLIIDSIVYSSDFNKLAVFVITKNPVHRQLIPDRNYDWYYDATCYLGIRQNDTISLSWVGSSFTNSYDKKELSSIIRDSYFTDFATKDTTGLHTHKFNMNDVRFWNSSIWKEIEFRKIKKQEFEEAKRKHPEDVYEPN